MIGHNAFAGETLLWLERNLALIMNVFGGVQKTTRGKRGPPGIDASITDLCKWLPRVITKSLQEISQIGSFIIKDLSRDIEKENVKDVNTWISRNTDAKKNLVLDKKKKAGKYFPLDSGYYAIRLEKSGYNSDDLSLLSFQKPGYFCITFRTLSQENQVLISDYTTPLNPFCEIQASRNGIVILILYSRVILRVPIEHNCKDWTTLFISQYIANYQRPKMIYKYTVNGKLSGSFKVKTAGEDDGICLGSRWEEPYMYFDGDVACIDFHQSLSEDQFEDIPDCLRDLIISNQMKIVGPAQSQY